MSGFDSKSLKWAEANVGDAKPCPFCGESLIVHADHHGAWLAHKNEATGDCFESIAQVMNDDNLTEWNTRPAYDAAYHRGRVAGLREAVSVLHRTGLPRPRCSTLGEAAVFAQTIDDAVEVLSASIRAAADKLEAKTP